MKCPACETEMIEQSIDTIVIDRCPSCNGLWFDAHETRIYFTGEKKPGSFIPDDHHFQLHVTPSGPECTRCQKSDLQSGVLRGAAFTRCPACRGVFIADSDIKLILSNRSPNLDLPKIGPEPEPFILIAGTVEIMDAIDPVNLLRYIVRFIYEATFDLFN